MQASQKKTSNVNSHLRRRAIIVVYLLLAFLLIISPNVFALPSITFSVAEQQGGKFTVAEGGAKVTVIATLSEPHSEVVSFSYSLFDPFTTAQRFSNDFDLIVPNDFGPAPTGATVNIPIGGLQGEFSITIYQDDFDEDDEVIFLNLRNFLGATSKESNLEITIIDDDKLPVIILSSDELTRNTDGSFSAADSEQGGVGLKLEIPDSETLSSFDLEVSYRIDQPEGISEFSEDFLYPGTRDPGLNTGIIVLPAKLQEVDFNLDLVDDAIIESQESIKLTLTGANKAIIHETHNNVTLTINDNDSNAGAINPTGVQNCYDDLQQIIECNSAGYPATDQDGSRPQAFDFVKLNESGDIMSSTASNPTCIFDRNTNLVWQVKTDSYIYYWLNRVDSINGGDEGFEGPDVSSTFADTCGGFTPCNTDHYADVLNSQRDGNNNPAGLCNIKTWRLPKLRELISIMDFESSNDVALIDENYFQVSINNITEGTKSAFYWTSTPAAVTSKSAWCVYFGKTNSSHVRHCDKTEAKPVRMVATCSPDPNADPNILDRPC